MFQYREVTNVNLQEKGLLPEVNHKEASKMADTLFRTYTGVIR